MINFMPYSQKSQTNFFACLKRLRIGSSCRRTGKAELFQLIIFPSCGASPFAVAI